jgi:DNA-binding XRE family transcriptional regulator
MLPHLPTAQVGRPVRQTRPGQGRASTRLRAMRSGQDGAPMIVTGSQIRAARALLGWTRQDLAKAAGLHKNTVQYWETSVAIPAGAHREPVACRDIREALRHAGVDVFSQPYAGVRLCRRTNNYTSTRARARPHHGLITPTPDDSRNTGGKTPKQACSQPPAKRQCGAKTRLGRPCIRKALANGRCPNHGGLSTGPKTEAGRQRISEVQKRRWAAIRSARIDVEARPE